MCKYQMDPASIVEDMDRRPDGQTDKVKPVFPLSTSLKWGVWQQTTEKYNKAQTL